MIPAVFSAVRFIWLSLTVFTVDVIALIPAELFFFTLTIPLLSTTNLSLAPTALSALIPTDPVLSTFIVPLFDSVTLGVPAALFPNIAAEPVEFFSRVIVPSFKAVLPSVATTALVVASSVVSIAIPAEPIPSTIIFELFPLFVTLESLAKIPADFIAFIVIFFVLVKSELFSPNIAADSLFSIVIVPLFKAVDLFA